MKRGLCGLIAVIVLLLPTSICFTADNASLFRDCLTVADVERITALEAVTMKETSSSPSMSPEVAAHPYSRLHAGNLRSVTKEFRAKDGQSVMQMTVGPGPGVCSMEFDRADKSGSNDFERLLVGDKAVFYPRHLVFTKGNFCVTIEDSTSRGKSVVTREHLIEIGNIVAGRL